MVIHVEARGVEFRYSADGEPALRSLDLTLSAGELACVLGPNGSGKSTLLRVLGGVLEPDAGTVRVLGDPLGELSPRERARRVASVPQSLHAPEDLLVEDFVLGGRYPHLGLWGRPRGGDREAVATALSEADADAYRGRVLGELSGGQRQRVLVARALAQEADVLLFDEPTNALDPEHQVLVFELIARLTGQGRSALVATHELNLASRWADTVALLDAGRLVALGSVEEVLRPEELGAVYGEHLLYGRIGEGPGRPLVVPWPAGDVRGGDRPRFPR